jgi:hypothetical protein
MGMWDMLHRRDMVIKERLVEAIIVDMERLVEASMENMDMEDMRLGHMVDMDTEDMRLELMVEFIWHRGAGRNIPTMLCLQVTKYYVTG